MLSRRACMESEKTNTWWNPMKACEVSIGAVVLSGRARVVSIANVFALRALGLSLIHIQMCLRDRFNHVAAYLQRHFDARPAVNENTATAEVSFFFSQADFDAFNLVRGNLPPLPSDTIDISNRRANLRISQYHGVAIGCLLYTSRCV